MRQLLFKKYFPPIAVFLGILFLPSCEKKYDTIIESYSSAPVLSNASLSQSTIDSDTIVPGATRHPDDILSIQVIASVQVSHSEGINKIGRVKYSLVNERFSSPLAEGFLIDDGNLPDLVKGDSIYSGYLRFQIPRVFVGQIQIIIWSESTSGNSSNTEILPLYIVRPSNFIPVLSNLIFPDTVHIDVASSIEIRVSVSDLDGFDDIKSVFRFTPSGKLFKMVDNGENGDAAANDGVFFELVRPVPPVGTYTLSFFAIDHSYDSSNVLSKTIVIDSSNALPKTILITN